MLRRAASFLPPSLLTLIYTSLIRSYLEYNSAVYATAAPTHLNKLDTIQKIASRIITNSPPLTHSAPLQLLLGLDPLDFRRSKHVVSLVEKIVSGRTHPFFHDFFSPLSNTASTSVNCNKNLDQKRFSRFGLRFYNDKPKVGCTNSRALELVSVGRSLSTSQSQMLYTATSTVSSSTGLSTADDAPAGHRG